MGQPFALDFGAVMQVAAARGVDMELLSAVLPVAEAAIVNGLVDQDGGDDDGE